MAEKDLNLDALNALTNPSAFKAQTNLAGVGIPKYDDNHERVDVHTMLIDISDVDFYKYNPRDVKNEAYYDIKDSIKQSGILNILSVSKNPKTLRFELINGGNTRLAALKELYKETGDERFAECNFTVYPWSNDDVVKIISHLIENEVRGKLLHVDKAKTIANLEQIFKQDFLQKDKKDSPPGGESFKGNDKDSAPGAQSLRKENYGVTAKFIEFLKRKNYSVASETLSTCRFTNNFLIGVIDYHLSQGLGTKKIAQIRLVYNNLKRLVKDKDIADFKENELSKLFKKALINYNKYKQPFDFYKLVDVVAIDLLENYPFTDLFAGDKEALTKLMLQKKPKVVKEKKPKEDNQDNKEDKGANENDSEENLQIDKGIDAGDDSNNVDADIISQGSSYDDEDDNEIIQEEKSSSQESSLADDFLDQNGYNNKGEAKDDFADNKVVKESLPVDGDLIQLRQKSYNAAKQLNQSVGTNIEIKEIGFGAGFLVVDSIDSDDFKDWCLFFVLLDLSLATDPLNAITHNNTDSNVLSLINDTKLSKLYFCSNAEDWEDEYYDLIDKSKNVAPLVSSVGGFKRNITAGQWQLLSQLEFLSYQINKLAKDSGVNIWEWV